jgi:glucan phosphorylase
VLDEGVLPPCKVLKTNPKKVTMVTNAFRNEEWSHFNVPKVQYARTMALDTQWEFHARHGEKFNKKKSKMKVRNWNGKVLTLAFVIMLLWRR